VDRLLAVEPWSQRRLTTLLAAGALLLNVVLVAVGVVAAAALVVRRLPALARTARLIGKVAVPVALVVLAVKAGIDIWRDAAEIL